MLTGCRAATWPGDCSVYRERLGVIGFIINGGIDMKSKFSVTYIIESLKPFESLVWFTICSAIVVFRISLH